MPHLRRVQEMGQDEKFRRSMLQHGDQEGSSQAEGIGRAGRSGGREAV